MRPGRIATMAERVFGVGQGEVGDAWLRWHNQGRVRGGRQVLVMAACVRVEYSRHEGHEGGVMCRGGNTAIVAAHHLLTMMLKAAQRTLCLPSTSTSPSGASHMVHAGPTRCGTAELKSA